MCLSSHHNYQISSFLDNVYIYFYQLFICDVTVCNQLNHATCDILTRRKTSRKHSQICWHVTQLANGDFFHQYESGEYAAKTLILCMWKLNTLTYLYLQKNSRVGQIQ